MADRLNLQIKALRKAKKVTQKELANALHVSFQTVSKWENGVAMPDITYLPMMAMYFDVSVEVILGMRPLEPALKYDDFSTQEYWERQLEATRNWKLFYFNDDYLEFLVKNVWKFHEPVHMLDCACGYGYLAEKILPHLPEGSTYTGFDVSEMYLQEARKVFGENNPCVQFVKGDILQYTSTKKYDLVISQMILTYLKEPEKVLRRMMESLKPGGMLVSIDISLPLAEEGVLLAKGNDIYSPKLPHPKNVWEYMEQQGEMNYMIGQKMAFLFRKIGLHHVDARLSDRVFTYDGRNAEGRDDEIVKYRNVIENLGMVEKKIAFYLDRGCSLPEAEVYVKHQENVLNMLEDSEVFVSKISGLYITWGYKEE